MAKIVNFAKFTNVRKVEVLIIMFNGKLLGERIKKIRGKKSQDIFANEIGISRGALSYYENGERRPDAEIIYKICKSGNVSSDYLLGFTDNPTTDENLQAVCKYTGLDEEAVKTLSDIKKSVEDGVALQPQILKYLSYIIRWNIEEFVTDIAFNYSDIQEKKDEKEQLNDTINDFNVNFQNPIEDIEKIYEVESKIRDIDEEIAFIEFKNTRCFHKLLTIFYNLLDDISADEILDDMLASEESDDNGKHNPQEE